MAKAKRIKKVDVGIYDANAVPTQGTMEEFGAHMLRLKNGVTFHEFRLGWVRYLQGCTMRNYADANGFADSSDEIAVFARQYAAISIEYARKLIAAARKFNVEKAMTMKAGELCEVTSPLNEPHLRADPGS